MRHSSHDAGSARLRLSAAILIAAAFLFMTASRADAYLSVSKVIVNDNAVKSLVLNPGGSAVTVSLNGSDLHLAVTATAVKGGVARPRIIATLEPASGSTSRELTIAALSDAAIEDTIQIRVYRSATSYYAIALSKFAVRIARPIPRLEIAASETLTLTGRAFTPRAIDAESGLILVGRAFAPTTLAAETALVLTGRGFERRDVTAETSLVLTGRGFSPRAIEASKTLVLTGRAFIVRHVESADTLVLTGRRFAADIVAADTLVLTGRSFPASHVEAKDTLTLTGRGFAPVAVTTSQELIVTGRRE